MTIAVRMAERAGAELTDAERLVDWVSRTLERDPEARSRDYLYASVPLCILDAIFSINSRYESARVAVLRYADHYGLRVERSRGELPPRHEQATVDQLIGQVRGLGPERFAAEVLQNRGRTSTRNGILKAEASLLFALVLREHGVQALDDLRDTNPYGDLSWSLEAIPGQASGITVRYFFMLTGADHLIKPDGMVLRFLERLLHRPVGAEEAQDLFTMAVSRVGGRWPRLTVQGLDHMVWEHERGLAAP